MSNNEKDLIWKNLKNVKNPATLNSSIKPNQANINDSGPGDLIKKSATNFKNFPKKLKETAATKIKIFISRNFQICLTPSSKIISNILAKLQDSSYDIKGNQWFTVLSNYDILEAELIKNKIEFVKIPEGIIKICKKEVKDTRYQLSGSIYDKLMEFQKIGVDFGINRNGRVLLADDMGLGKTIQALAIANHYRLEYPLLIITPSSLCYNWVDSIYKFLDCDSVIIKEISDFGSNISIISYNMAVNFIETIKSIGFKVIICDECHYIKSNTSKRTKVLLPVLQKASRLIMISGTPATSRPVELYPIICALDRTLFPNFHSYGFRYCDGRKLRNFYDFKGCTNAEELNTVLEKYFMIRRLKGLVLSELPLKSRRQIILKIPKRNLNLTDVNLDNPDTTVMQEYKEAATIKKDPVIKYLECLVEKDIKFLVFGHHKEMLDALEEFCINQNRKFIRVDGSTLPAKRASLVDAFQKDDSIRIAVLSITACSTGLTLTSGKAVVFAELYWNPGIMLQAEDRIHRIGQKDNIDIHYLIASNTVDELVWPKLLKKLNVLESLGVGKNELKEVKGIDLNQTTLNIKKNI